MVNTRSITILADIDDIFCHTLKKFRKYVGDENSLGEPCVFDANGKPLSYRSRKQEVFLDWLNLAATIVPITGRSTEKYRQVELGFSSYAITSFGATILTPEGTADPVWLKHISAQSRLSAPQLASLHDAVKSGNLSASTKTSIVTDNGLQLFLKVQDSDSNQENLDAAARIIRANLPQGWTLHLNEGQLCAYPGYLDKLQAAQYYLDHLAGPRGLVIGVGDSLTDAGFMSVCDFMIAPTQSQIFKSIKSE